MRSRIVIPVLVLGVGLLTGLVLLRQGGGAPKGNLPVAESEQAEQKAAENEPATEPKTGKETRSQAAMDGAAPGQEAGESEGTAEARQRAYAEQRVAELYELSMNDDSASLESILSELTNRDPEIRKAALEATVQFRSREAIPRLLEAASQTDDPHEKAAIADAIEFLKLPTLSEVMEQGRPSARGGPGAPDATLDRPGRPAPKTTPP
ncbi:MAG: HEAT repeat domain-containing protein [Verrucomicrobiota bacterium]|jgi:hypothetical protein